MKYDTEKGSNLSVTVSSNFAADDVTATVVTEDLTAEPAVMSPFKGREETPTLVTLLESEQLMSF